MTAPEPMTREELHTLAVLDVFGLLDEYESNLYTRSFHHASAAVQDEILELQAEIASFPPLVSGEEPVSELRGQVLQSVMDAMDKESRQFAPIASIGRGRPRASMEMTPRPMQIRGAQFWRAAAFVLAGALVVLAYFFVDTVQRVKLMEQVVIGMMTPDQVKNVIGSDFESFIDNPDCTQIVLASTDAQNARNGVLYVNRKTNEAFLYTAGLPHDANQYVLRYKTAEGSFENLKTFATRQSLFGLRLDQVSSALLAPAVQWEIASLDGTTIFLRSA